MSIEQSSFARALVLVVEDEPNIAALMKTTLTSAGIEAQSAISGQDALLQLAQTEFDAVVLDINLPDMDGFALMGLMRENEFSQPVLYVTARELTSDRVRGLTLGAEDYIVKPFDPDEFVARVRVCLRRIPKFASVTRTRIGTLEIDASARRAWRSGIEVELTPTEFSILNCLAQNPGRPVSRQRILSEVWFEGYRGPSTLLDPFMSHLRKKVDFREPHLIRTVRGIGYMLRVDT